MKAERDVCRCIQPVFTISKINQHHQQQRKRQQARNQKSVALGGNDA